MGRYRFWIVLIAIGPLIGGLTLVSAVILGGRSIESSDPASGVQYLSLLLPIVWGALAYRLARNARLVTSTAVAAAVLAVLWAIGSVLLVLAIAS
jgi:hypothetical protein